MLDGPAAGRHLIFNLQATIRAIIPRMTGRRNMAFGDGLERHRATPLVKNAALLTR